MKRWHNLRFLLPVLLAVAGSCSFAMSDLSESDMAEVSGQVGLTVLYSGNTSATNISASNIRWNVDCGAVANCTGSTTTYPQESYLSINTAKFGPIGTGGAAAVTPFQIASVLDVGATGTTPAVSLSGTWNRTRLSATSMTLRPDSTTSYGMYAFDSQGQFSIVNSHWLFDTSCAPSCTATVSLGTTAPAQLYYRQASAAGSPELLFDNMNFSLSASGAQLGIYKTGGLYFSQATANLNWNFDLRYRANPSLAYRNDQGDITNFLYFGLESGLVNPVFQILPGGVWLSGSPTYDTTSRNNGLNFSFITDLDSSTFALVMGEGGATPTLVRFEAWRRLKAGTSMLSIPNLTFDVVRGGGAGVPNIPTDFCLGADNAATASYCNANYKDRDPTPSATLSRYVTSPATGAEGDALAILARNVQLLAYPTRVKVVDPVAGTSTYNWGLLTTTGDLNATLMLYPGTGTAGTTGVKIDAVVSASTPQVSAGDWDESLGTHFMLADTDANTGVGFLNMNYLIKADNLFMKLQSTGVNYSCAGAAGATTCFSVYADGQFGGGDLLNLSDKTKSVRGFDLIIRQNFSNFSFTLTPDINKLDYSASMTLDNANKAYNYVMLAEPDYDAVAFKFGQMSGAANINNGIIDLQPSNTTADGLTHLAFKQDFVVTSDFKIDDISFNGQSLGRIVIPAGGSLHTELTLKPQVP